SALAEWAEPLTLLVHQLWFSVDPAISFRLRQAWSRRTNDRILERYWVLPSAGRARLLVPAAPRHATAGAMRNHRRLRSSRERVLRAPLAMLGRVGLPLSPHALELTV